MFLRRKPASTLIFFLGCLSTATACPLVVSSLDRLPLYNGPPRLTIDAFVLSAYEIDTLTIRITETQDLVDIFVVAQCNMTYSLQPAVVTDLSKIPRLRGLVSSGKIIPILCDTGFPAHGDNPWPREEYMRKQTLRFVRTLIRGEDDIIILGDIDEMMSREALAELQLRKLTEPVGIHTPLTKYTYGCFVPSESDWTRASAVSGAYAQAHEGDEIRISVGSRKVIFRCAGWHCSSCFTPIGQKRKLETFTHYLEMPESRKNLNTIAYDTEHCTQEGIKWVCRDPGHLPAAVVTLKSLEYLKPRCLTT